jgi:hypothetical protein
MTNPVLNIYDTDEKITLTINNQGPIGLSAYQVWLAKGNTGSEQDFLDSLQGDGVNADWLATSGNAQILNKPTLATVATTGSYIDLLNKPTLGSAAALDSTAFATASQGALANTAVQPGQLIVYETTTQLNNRDTANRNRANHTGTQSISTIIGTKTQFNNAVTDGDFLYVGDVTQYTDELAQDAVGGILTDTTSIDFTYNDGSNSITADVKNNSTTQRIEVARSGSLISTRKRLNLIEGSNVTLTVTDDNVNDETDVTISATGGDSTNLGYTASATDGTVTSSTGISATIPAGSTVNASLILPADKTKLNGIEIGAQVNTITSVAGRTGAIVLIKTDVGLSNVVNLDTSITTNITDSTNKRFVTDTQRTVLTNTSGINTGDQTAIVGITGTKTQFNNAVTDGDFLYIGDVTQYTDELAQDAVGNILSDTTSIDFTYNDASNLITADVKVRNTSTANTTIAPSGVGVEVLSNSTTQRIEVAKAGSLISTRKRLNLIEGSNVTVTVTDDNVNDETDVTISSTIADGDRGDITVSSAGTIWTVDPQAITYTKIQDVSSNRLLGRITAGSGSIEEVNGTQVTSLLNTFTSSLKGLAPASGGGTTNFLRADGTWSPPAGGGGGISNTDAIVYALIFG